MSRENVELARRSLEAFERGDVEGALASAHPELVATRVHRDGAVFTFADGRITRFEVHADREQALSSAGLPEQRGGSTAGS